MNTPQECLHQIILSLILYELQKGLYSRCKALGIPELAMIEISQTSADEIARLIFSTVPWLKVEIDMQLVRRIIKPVHLNDEKLINQAVLLGASGEILERCFGIHHRETARRRRMLSCETRRGRMIELTEDESVQICTAWKTKVPDDGIAIIDGLKIMMTLADEFDIPLSHIWKEIIAHGLFDAALDTAERKQHEYQPIPNIAESEPKRVIAPAV